MPDELRFPSKTGPDVLLHQHPPQHHSPRRREKKAVTPIVTPIPTPAASPERRRRNAPSPQEDYARPWPAVATRTAGAAGALTAPYSHLNRGHQFTVGNVSNGMIYLRPVIRPAHELHQNFGLLPSTPPSSLEERQDAFRGRDDTGRRDCSRVRQSSPPRTPVQGVRLRDENDSYLNSSPPIPRTQPHARHHRSHSCTTVGEHVPSIKEPEIGSFQLRIDQVDGPSEDYNNNRPRTAGYPESFRSLDVQIPHYNLGSPRFSPNGTPFLYGSSSLHIPSTQGELGSPSIASQHTDVRWLWPGGDPRSLTPSGLSPAISSSIASTMAGRQSHPLASAPTTPAPLLPSPSVPEPSATSLISSGTPLKIHSVPKESIVPAIYDRLSFPPMSEHPSVVRYDASSQEIVAAIPARIVAQITSAAFVDYHLLSDFFLTYRLFMSFSHLCAYLMTRLRWAIDRGDDTGKVVRVRTFVAIRHWLLNYFADDFVPSLPNRTEFANALNELAASIRDKGNASDLKIIGELKKCWRRTCALYWDSEDNAEGDTDISPGGSPGKRKDSMRPQSSLIRLQKMTPPPRLDSVRPDNSSGTETFLRDVVEPLRIVKAERVGQSQNRLGKSGKNGRGGKSDTVRSKSLASALSLTSSDASAKMAKSDRTGSVPFDPRKGSSSMQPSALSSVKRLRAGPHKRSGSFSDALRDNRQPLPLPNSFSKPSQLFMALPYAGSLVRGNLFPPTPAFVEVIAPSTPLHDIPGIKLSGSSASDKSALVLRASERSSSSNSRTNSGPGVKKLLGSVRRALSARVPNSAGPKMAGRFARAPATITRSPSVLSNASIVGEITTNMSRNRMDMFGDGQAARIDLLGAGAVAAFQRAMERNARNDSADQTSRSSALAPGDEESAAASDITLPMDGAMDEATDSRTDVRVELGSRASRASEDGARGTPETQETEGFLDSPSTASPPAQDALVSGEVSFLADQSEQSVSSRNSIKQEPAKEIKPPSIARPFSDASRFSRRSKSFSFERAPSRFTKHIGNIDENLPGIQPSTNRAGKDGKSLYSARSFSIKRAASVLSDYTGMDISELYSDVSSIAGSVEDVPAPRMLRRRPGGNLRAAVTVGDLDIQPRPKSDSSVMTGVFTWEDAIQMPPFRRVISPTDRPFSKASGPQHIAPGVVSLGAVAKGGGGLMSPPPPMPEPQHHEERSSIPEADPKASFEAGVQRLRDLPDDDSDDGGVEVALAKLEGTYQRKKSTGEVSPILGFHNKRETQSHDFESSMVVVDENDKRTTGYDGADDEHHQEHDNDGDEPAEHMRRLKRRHKQVVDHVALQTPPLLDGNKSRIALVREESEDSLPILERGLSINTFQIQPPPKGLRKSPAVSDIRSAVPASSGSERERPSRSLPPSDVDLLRVDSELERHLSRRHTSKSLRDDISELSSEISFEMVQSGTGNNSMQFPPMNSTTIISELGLPSHPLRHPPSPPLTLEQALTLSATNDGSRTPHSKQPSNSGRAGVSPGHTFTTNATNSYSGIANKAQADASPGTLRPTAIHLPFILAYDSELLAKQFTIIEKDALLEVDWKELVELSWSQTDSNVKDWVELLNSKDIKGVEVVIARFNLMCKWARSEVVMTKNVDERARAIVKLIHIAAHARRLQNYTTMYQITIALLTADITRLRKTWDLVSSADMETFRELEALVQPVRNFHNLRIEMEKVTGESGCIPFVGLFTHDLILNAQRPALIPYDPSAEPLVNFERHRTTAAIVKRLLRLIEASHKYSFEAVDGVCERCLWVAALSDDEIRSLSKSLEQ